MGLIKQLEPLQAQQIAAGEVVERPANVVKELVENAIDAGATTITLECSDAGKQMIRISDNGCGMNLEDARMCILHHATSKITAVSDIDSIRTFGFRGEALSSIASVSKMTLVTREKSADSGLRLAIENGVITDEQTVSASIGTHITIRNLFYNVPARQKFLKKRETEWRHIMQMMTAFCLSYKNIHFKIVHDGKQILNCASTESLTQRAAQIWDHSVSKHLIELSDTDSGAPVQVYGIVSNHQYYRYDRNALFFFVNSRWVKNYTLSRSLLKGYANVLPPARYPVAALFVSVDTKEVDVNVHPRKEEVQFLHPRRIETKISLVVKDLLEKQITQRLVTPQEYVQSPTTKQFAASSLPTRNFFDRSPFNRPGVELSEADKRGPMIAEQVQSMPVQTVVELQRQTSVVAAQKETQPYRLLGQFKKTYLLLEQDDGLFLIDQHAAHERILYERFGQRFENVSSVKCVFSESILLKEEELSLVLQNVELFAQCGIELEQSSTTHLRVQATPVCLRNQSIENFVREVLGIITEHNSLDKREFTQRINNDLRAMMACKAAVKAGDILTTEQMEQLLADLSQVDNRLTCPHGRPTGWLLDMHEIEKKFKRKK